MIWLPQRTNTFYHDLPVRFIFDLPSNCDKEGLTERIRQSALSNLINYNDICACPFQCRHFSVEASDEPYFTRSLPPWKQRRYKPLVPRKLYILKMCSIGAKGFRQLRQVCPHKTVATLDLYLNEKERVHTGKRHQGFS